MKIIFLDFDGVLNVHGKTHMMLHQGVEFDKKPCANLNKILTEVPDAKIVVSSSWRVYGLEGVKDILAKSGIDSSRVIDITGREMGERGHQCVSWIHRNPGVESFIAIDDESDFSPMLIRLVKTSSYVGLTENQANEAIEMLKDPTLNDRSRT